ncbi:MAG: CvpA family protein [Planctomycetaceae bacterium]|jgi:membrane protein required for colicin V production
MYYDALLLLILGWSGWRGSSRGVTWQLASIASLLLCFAFAAPASLIVAPLIKLDPPLNRWLAMLAVYILFSFGAYAAARVIRSLLAALKFQEFDQHLGGLFGLLKGVLASLILTFFVVTLSPSAREQVLRTQSGRVAGYLLYKARGILPQELAPTLAPHFDVIRNELIEIATERDQAPGSGHPSVLPFDLNPQTDEATATRETSPPRPANPRDRRPPMVIAADSTVDPTATDASQGSANTSSSDPWSALTRSLTNRLKNQISDLLNPAPESPAESEPPHDLVPAIRPKVTPTGGTAGIPPAGAPGNTTKPLGGSAAAPPRNVPKTPDPELDRLTTEIVQAFATTAADRNEMSAGIADHFRGLPPSLVRLVLQDWKADIYGNVADPDPGTVFETPIERRIQRQLKKAGIPLSQFPADMQHRLQPR